LAQLKKPTVSFFDSFPGAFIRPEPCFIQPTALTRGTGTHRATSRLVSTLAPNACGIYCPRNRVEFHDSSAMASHKKFHNLLI
jgi:hypothetical protein